MHEYTKVYHHKFNKPSKHSHTKFHTSSFVSHVNLSCKYYLCWLYMLAHMQRFKKFKFLVVFKLGQILGCYKPIPLKKNLVLEIRDDPQIDREIPF